MTNIWHLLRTNQNTDAFITYPSRKSALLFVLSRARKPSPWIQFNLMNFELSAPGRVLWCHHWMMICKCPRCNEEKHSADLRYIKNGIFILNVNWSSISIYNACMNNSMKTIVFSVLGNKFIPMVSEFSNRIRYPPNFQTDFFGTKNHSSNFLFVQTLGMSIQRNFMRCRSMNHRPKRVTLLQRFNGKTCIAIDEWHKTGPGKTTKPSGSNQFQSSFRLLIIQCWKSRAHTYVPSTHLVIWRIASETQLVDLSRC